MLRKILFAATALAGAAFVPVLAFAQSGPYQDWRGGYGPWHMWGGVPGFGWIFPLLMIVFMIAFFVFLLSRTGSRHSHGDRSSSALDILGERFAKGEISEKEFEEKRKVLRRP